MKKDMLKQKLLGLILVIIGVFVPFIDNDASASIILIPIGLYMIFTRENIFLLSDR